MSNSHEISLISFKKNLDGTIYLTGIEKNTKKKFTLKCTAEQLCQTTLTPNNKNNKKTINSNLFKLTDIPSVMRKKQWNKAAYLNEKWLNGVNLSMNPEEKGQWSEVRSSLILYEPKIFNHQWLKKFQRYRDGVNALGKTLTSAAASKQFELAIDKKNIIQSVSIGKKYTYRSNYDELKKITKSSENNSRLLKKFHKKYQFQFYTIDKGIISQTNTYISNNYEIDDLWATFGSFAIYAAIGDYTIIPETNGYRVIIDSFICYAIDSYDFIIKGGNPDDYLGHWNKENFDFNVLIKDKENNINTHRHSRTGEYYSTFIPEKILYPVFNRHYQEYRKLYNKGQDMVVWTEITEITMRNMERKYREFFISK
ncbi:DUF6402 family protein [Psychrobacter aestuarii]|uniref:Uncharacterized protein n=1 Tax=Psychrobacter aestuarii TaxID=556327 RepID=A0ABN0VRY9_9GAMM|nr:DUF6402 family protein [Psychrobacter aestuarii]